MPDRIVIERLEFYGRCGVTDEERAQPQRLAVDVELDAVVAAAAQSDRLTDTIDYARVAERIVALGTSAECRLLEALANRLIDLCFAEFPVARVRIWLRKLRAPLTMVTGSVGVRFDRRRPAQASEPLDPPPADFLVQQRDRLPKGRALDLASGRGRNARYLLSQGFQVHAIDRDAAALAELQTAADTAHDSGLTTQVLDLEHDADHPPTLGQAQYDVILVCFYLHRPLFPAILDALKPQGVLLYETFTIDNYFRRGRPRRWEFCLAHNELLRLTTPLRVLHYDEGEHESDHGMAATARLIAQKTEPDVHP